MTRVPFLQQRRGFSLAELIIYLGILGISAGIFGGMLNTISTTQIAEFNQNEVSGQLNFAIQTIQRYVRAASIIEGESGTPSSTLVLQMPVAAQNPTSISLQNNRIYITQGATGTPLAITNDKVSIDNLEFRRFAQPASKDVVQIDIAISQESAGGKRIARSLRSAITRVNAAAFDSDLIPNSDGSYNVGTYPSARWRDGSFSGQVSAGSFCFASDCRTSWANIAGVSGSGSANYVAKWNTASTINASTLIYDNGTNVGIGAINPGYKLDVQGGQINTSGGLCINGDCKTAWSQIAGTQAWTATGTSIYYNTGNVGIGTASPAYPLEINGVLKVNGNAIRTGGSPMVFFNGTGGAWASISTAGINIGDWDTNPSYGDILVGTYNFDILRDNGTSIITALNSGNVGIGTTSPTAKLHVSGGNILLDNNLALQLKDSTGTAQNVFFAGTDNVLYIQPLNVTKGTSIQYGNLGLGTNVPTAKLQVNPGTAVEGIRIISSDYSPFIIRNSADTADLFRVDQNGNITGGTGNASAWTRNSTSGYLYTSTLTDNVGIGTASPAYGLHVNRNLNQVAGFQSPNANTWIDINSTVGSWSLGAASNNSFQIYERGTANQSRLTVLNGGNVGIGTTNPTRKLEINGQGVFTTSAEIVDGGTTSPSLRIGYLTSGDYGYIQAIESSQHIEKLVLQPNGGNVGIGTASPAQKLSVAGTIESTSGGIKFPDGTTQTTAYAGGTQTIVSGNVSSGAFGSNTGGGNYSFPGNVGIGTTSPSALLDVRGGHLYVGSETFSNPGSWASTINLDGSSHARILIEERSTGVQTSLWAHTGGNAKVGTISNHNFGIITSGAERMTFDTSGNVGIGTTSPGNKLHISSAGSANTLTTNIKSAVTGSFTAGQRVGLGSLIGFMNDTGVQYAQIGAYCASDCTNNQSQLGFWTEGSATTFTTANVKMVIDPIGNVGIGTASPAQKLSVAGTIESTSGGVKFPDGTTQTTAYAGGTQTVVAGNVSSGAFGANTGGGNYSFPANLGIGTTTLSASLDIQSSGNTNGSSALVIKNSSLTEMMRLLNNGNLGIGNTNPTSRLEVGVTGTGALNAIEISGASFGQLGFIGANTTNAGTFFLKPASGVKLSLQEDGGSDSLVVDTTGYIGIGTSSPTHALDVSGSFYSRLVTKGNCTGAVTIDWNAGNTQHCVLTGNVTFTFSNGQSGGNYKLVLKQGGTGSYIITWPGTVRWGGAVSPTLTTTVGKSDYVGFFYNGVDSTYDGNAFNANF